MPPAATPPARRTATTSPVNSRVTISRLSWATCRSASGETDRARRPLLSNQAEPSDESSRPWGTWSIERLRRRTPTSSAGSPPVTSSPRAARDVHAGQRGERRHAPRTSRPAGPSAGPSASDGRPPRPRIPAPADTRRQPSRGMRCRVDPNPMGWNLTSSSCRDRRRGVCRCGAGRPPSRAPRWPRSRSGRAHARGVPLAEVAARFGPHEAICVLDDPLRDGGDRALDPYAARRRGPPHRARPCSPRGVAPGGGWACSWATARCSTAPSSKSALARPWPPPSMLATELALVVATGPPWCSPSRLLARRFGEDLAALAPTDPHPAAGWRCWADGHRDELLADGEAVPADAAGCRGRHTTIPGSSSSRPGRPAPPKGILHRHGSPSLRCWFAGPRVRPASRHPHVQRPAPVLDRRVPHRRRRHPGRRWLLGIAQTFDPPPRWPDGPRAGDRALHAPHQTAALAEHPDWASTDLSALRCVYGKGAYARHPRVEGDPGWIMPGGLGHVGDVRLREAPTPHAPRSAPRSDTVPLLPGAGWWWVDPAYGEASLSRRGGRAVRLRRHPHAGVPGPPARRVLRRGRVVHTGDAGHVSGRQRLLVRAAHRDDQVGRGPASRPPRWRSRCGPAPR